MHWTGGYIPDWYTGPDFSGPDHCLMQRVVGSLVRGFNLATGILCNCVGGGERGGGAVCKHDAIWSVLLWLYECVYNYACMWVCECAVGGQVLLLAWTVDVSHEPNWFSGWLDLFRKLVLLYNYVCIYVYFMLLFYVYLGTNLYAVEISMLL